MKTLLISLFTVVVLCISATASSNWIDFAVDDRLLVSLPTQPNKMVKDTVEADGFEQHLQIFSCHDDYGYYRVSRDDLRHESDDYLTPQGRREWYSAGPVIEGMRGAKLLKREEFRVVC